MKKMKIVSFVLAILISGISCVSCGNKESNDNNKLSDVSINETEKDDASGSELGIPDELRFDGESFNVYIALSTLKNSFVAESENGNLLNDAVFRRNALTEKRLDVDLNFETSTLTSSGADQATERDKISSLILAGDTTYDAYLHVQHTGMPGLIMEGMFIDWNILPHIDFTNPWWYENCTRDINFGGKVFCMTGDYNIHSFCTTACLAFNKEMLDELELEYPYQLVKDGTWTHDRFVEYIMAATKDLNGDGNMDFDNDRYGFGGWEYEQIPGLYVGYGGETLKKNDRNMPVLNIYSEKQNNIIDAMIDVFGLGGSFYEGSDVYADETLFKEGRLLFNDSFIAHIEGMRNYDFEVGFIPYPKFNEAQESYYSRTANVSGLTYIPVTLDPSRYELVGATLETLAYFGNKEVLPTYFDTIITVQSTRDVESEEMIPVIRNSSRFMDQAIEFYPDTIVKSGQNTLASHWVSSKAAYEERLKKLCELYAK